MTRNAKRLFCYAVALLATTGLVVTAAPEKKDDKKKQEVAAPKPTPPKCPATFQAKFTTTCGDFVVEVTRKWSPLGADRFHEAITGGFYDGCAFFRVLPDFVVQFGINGDPKVQRKWRLANLKDDPPAGQSNTKGTLTFAKSSAKNSRTTQLFINLSDNAGLDGMGFTPFGRIVKGMETVKKINSQYRQDPNQARLQQEGTAYLKKAFPKLDYIKTARVVKPAAKKKKP